jgi:hypothetical protein
MPTPRQTAFFRPISFILHDTSAKDDLVEHKLVIRPEELTRSEISRTTTHQTLGGAWADSFGKGLPTININGITGWGQGSLPNGELELKSLYKMVYTDWHDKRAKLAAKGVDPDKVKLIFNDELDGFTWVIALNSFILKRSKSRPLLSQYQISMTYLSDNISDETKNLIAKARLLKDGPVLTALRSALSRIIDFVDTMRQKVADYFGPMREGVMLLMQITGAVLNGYTALVTGGVLSELGNLASGLTTASFNVMSTMTHVQNLPTDILAKIIGFKSALMSVNCIIMNQLRPPLNLPNYDDVYGASICSSTAGGRPLSQYLNTNTFEVITPVNPSKIAVNNDSVSAIGSLSKMDVALHPLSLIQVGSLSQTAAKGIMVLT